MPIILVPPEELQRAWPIAAPLLQPAIERSRGTTSPQAVATAVASGQKQLWFVCVDGEDGKPRAMAAGITSLQGNADGTQTANIELLSGEDMKSWFGFKGDFEDWAKAEGCKDIRLWARKGWAKHLPDFHLASYIMRKEL